MYTAVIVEPRVHNALPFVLKNFDENLPDEWSILVIHGTENNIFIKDFIKNSNITRIQTVELNIKNLTTQEYSNLLKTKDFYNFIHPWSDDLPYTYDAWDFDYCADQGFSFTATSSTNIPGNTNNIPGNNNNIPGKIDNR